MSLPLLLALGLLAAALVLSGWGGAGPVGAWVRKSRGVILVFGLALVATRNIGLAIFAAMIAQAVLSRAVWLGKGSGPSDGARGPTSGAMAVEEAYRVLDLRPGATRGDVLAAYRSLITRNHPDQGGSTYLAAQVNEAKDVLLRHIES
jgi:hypothetical protein